MLPRLIELARAARRHDLTLTIDAEEQDRLDLTLDHSSPPRSPTPPWRAGPVSASPCRPTVSDAIPVLRWLRRLADQRRKRIPVRLVKGAYWDRARSGRAQERGLADYPVLTRKLATDVSYLAAMRLLRRMRASSRSSPRTMRSRWRASRSPPATGRSSFSDCMASGEALYEEMLGEDRRGLACRIYAPVGAHADLAPYLVRRLLENGANTSFVSLWPTTPCRSTPWLPDPVEGRRSASAIGRCCLMPRPPEIFAPARLNSGGHGAAAGDAHRALSAARDGAGGALCGGTNRLGARSPIAAKPWSCCAPDRRQRIGTLGDRRPNHDRGRHRRRRARRGGQDLAGGAARAGGLGTRRRAL